jgi:hypothetical protein
LALLNHLTLPVIRIVLLPACCDANRVVEQYKGQKKRAAVCAALSLTAPGPPGVEPDNTGLLSLCQELC